MCEANLIKNPFFPSSHATTGEQLKHYNPFCSRSLLARKEKKIGQTVDKEFSFVVKGCLLELITVTRLLKSHFQAFFPVFFAFQSIPAWTCPIWTLHRHCTWQSMWWLVQMKNSIQRFELLLQPYTVEIHYRFEMLWTTHQMLKVHFKSIKQIDSNPNTSNDSYKITVLSSHMVQDVNRNNSEILDLTRSKTNFWVKDAL